jgi:hypothetical protein
MSAPSSVPSGIAVTGIVRVPTWMLTSGVCKMLRYQAALGPHPDATTKLSSLASCSATSKTVWRGLPQILPR